MLSLCVLAGALVFVSVCVSVSVCDGEFPFEGGRVFKSAGVDAGPVSPLSIGSDGASALRCAPFEAGSPPLTASEVGNVSNCGRPSPVSTDNFAVGFAVGFAAGPVGDNSSVDSGGSSSVDSGGSNDMGVSVPISEGVSVAGLGFLCVSVSFGCGFFFRLSLVLAAA